MKIHKQDLFCGSSHTEHTTDDKKVTCKKCLRLIADDKPNKTFKIRYSYFADYESKIIDAPTASKAIYKCFKIFCYNDDMCEGIGEQWQWFRNSKPKAILTKTKSLAMNRNDTYCSIFIENVSGSYHLDRRWVLPYLESNKNIERLRD